MAIHPSKIMLALVLLVLVYLCGTLVDVIFFSPVYPNERDFYGVILEHRRNPQKWDQAPALEQWRAEQREYHLFKLKEILTGEAAPPNRLLRVDAGDSVNRILDTEFPYRPVIDRINHAFEEAYARVGFADEAAVEKVAHLNADRRALIRQVKNLEPKGVFVAAAEYKLACLNELVKAAANFNLGLGELMPRGIDTRSLPASSSDSPSVVGVLKKLVLLLPGWLWAFHPWFLIVFGFFSMIIWALVGGAIARLAALHAARDERATAGSALTFSMRRLPWFFVAPVLPVVFCAVIGLLVAVAGAVLLNVWVVEWLGGLAFVLAIGAGAVITLTLILLAGGHNLLFPGIAVEGTDALDAISRAFNYVSNRPWRLIFYNVVALIYGAITYVFLSVVVYLTLLVTHRTAGLFAWRSSYGADHFDTMLPKPAFGQLLQDVDWFALNWSAKVTAVMVNVWIWLSVAVLAAFAVSFYFCASTWVYLLLRRSADGTDFDEVFIDGTDADAEDDPTFAVEAAAATDGGADDAGGDQAGQ